jgi:ParB family chromosome partitioning protein
MAKQPEELAQQIVELGLSVRQAEDRAKGIVRDENTLQTIAKNIEQIEVMASPKKRPQLVRRAAGEKNEDVLQLENMLSESLGLRVSIDTRGGQAGDVVISYDSLTQLDEILRRLGGGV